jgi:hypothetical protein
MHVGRFLVLSFSGIVAAGAVAAGCGSESGESTFSEPDGAPGPSNPNPFGTPALDAGCGTKTCAELGWSCGYTVDDCGKVTNCADEGRACKDGEVCIGGIDAPTKCVASGGGAAACDVCTAVPTCDAAGQTKTKITGRVVSPGRSDGDTGNQVGVPNAIVYIPQSSDPAKLPPISTGIPANGTSCDRCDQENLGRVLAGAVTDARGNFTIEGNIPVGKEFLLVVKAGKFRRAVKHTIPAAGACQTTALPTTLPASPTRLPRTKTDGLAVNIPRIAISTGQIDAMECVFEKMGVAATEFGNPGATGTAEQRIHLYRGGPSATPRGARIDDNTPHDTTLYGAVARLSNYDILVADCEGLDWDDDLADRNANGAHVREYVNRGGRMFASHLSFTWLHENGTQAYAAATPIATGLGPVGTWDMTPGDASSGTGRISLGRTQASPRIQNFTAWMVAEQVVGATAPHDFSISHPRSQNLTMGTSTEEFVHRTDGDARVQQFSFNTPYAAPVAAACGRVAYSGFHVAPLLGGGDAPYATSIFPQHCSGDLTNQEKVLLYMLFDLAACVGVDPVPPVCTPETCASAGATCGFTPDGCGKLLDCGPCSMPK